MRCVDRGCYALALQSQAMNHSIASRSRAVTIGALVCCLASCQAARTPEARFDDRAAVNHSHLATGDVASLQAASRGVASFAAPPLEPHSTTPTELAFEPRGFTATPVQDLHGRRDGTYLQSGFGLVTTQTSNGPTQDVDFDNGYAVPLAIGWHLPGKDDAFALDLEVEALYTDQDVDDNGLTQAVTDITQIALLFNALADFEVGESLSLYAGGGIGLSFLDIGTTNDGLSSFDDEDGPFLAWQLKGGVRWWMSDALSWSVGYRLLNVDDVEIDDGFGSSSFDLETRQHVIELGIRVQL